MANVVGPGAVVQDSSNPEPTLSKAHEYEFVTILNPLGDDFQVMVAQDVPVNMPLEVRGATKLTQGEGDITRNYGLDLKNPDHQAKKYIYNKTVIPAGQTRKFRGDHAQVAVKQLVDEILQREGKRRLIADPVLRQEVESRIIQSRSSINDLMTDEVRTPQAQVMEAINQSNEASNETSFPGLDQATGSQEAGVSDTPKPDTSIKEPVEKTAKANS